jgi:hypothetical protein
MMSVEQDQSWITREELGREWRRLMQEKVTEDAPAYQEFLRRVLVRDDFLFERYGLPSMETHPGQWIAISLDGQVILRNTSAEAAHAAREQFGGGNHAIRKLADFPGCRL